MAQKPSIPKGTRDFGPEQMARRNYLFSTLREAFRLFGYSQIETPAMETLATLMGKYGEEGDRLLFKILNSGDFREPLSEGIAKESSIPSLTRMISEKGLRYDLTVPFARFVVQHRAELTMPFKRFQMQPVWRADRPQKGRYREFWQCDADVVGSTSLLNEVELLRMEDHVFGKLGIRVVIKLNNRKVLGGIAEVTGLSDRLTDITVAIDKIDKIGIEGAEAELREKGISEEALAKLRPVLGLEGDNSEKLDKLSEILASSEEGMKGVEELRFVVNTFDSVGHKCEVEIDCSLARGLDYYTGTIIEVKALDAEMGSISGGGRYDNLTGVFGAPGLSGVGVSFGADRIYDVLTQLDLYPQSVDDAVTVLFLNFGEAEALESIKCVAMLQQAGVSAALYPDCAKMKKQMGAANDQRVPFVAMIGADELAQGKVTLKDMASGEQYSLTKEELLNRLSPAK